MIFSTSTNVNFFDADPAGIMFFANAFRFAHSAYEKLITVSPFNNRYFTNESFVVPIVHSEADFLRPVFVNSNLKIEIVVSKLKESSFELAYLFRNEMGEECLRVRTVHVFLDKGTWKKIPLPEEFREFLNKYSGLGL